MKGFTQCRHAEFISASSPKGFTLIELLVVVLIIGILSAVALPMYTKAVTKSKAVLAFQMAEQVQRAQEMYWLANGQYSNGPANLDIFFPDCIMSTDDHEGQLKCKDWFLTVNYAWRGAVNVMFCPGWGQKNCGNVAGTNSYKAIKMMFTFYYDHAHDYFASSAGSKTVRCYAGTQYLCTFFDSYYK